MKKVKKLGETILFYKRGVYIHIVDITKPEEYVTSLFLDDDYNSFDHVMKQLWDYIDFYVVGERSEEPLGSITIFISNIVP